MGAKTAGGFPVIWPRLHLAPVWALLVAIVALVMLPATSQAAPSGGLVVAWGDNTQGQTDVPAGLSGMTAIAAGFYHSLAVRSDGTVIGWGGNGAGQATIPAGLSGVTAVAAGYAHSLALKSDGTVVAWGDNGYGQATVPPNRTGETVTAIAAGANHSLALTSAGAVVAWGDSSVGQTTVPDTAFSGIVAIAAGANHSLALTSGGTVVAWGDDSSGQTNVPQALIGVTALAAGISHSLAIVKGGVVAWGSNTYGQLDVPPGLGGVTAVAAGQKDSLALLSDGTVVEWGNITCATCSPVRGGQTPLATTMPPGLNGVFGFAGKYGHSLVLKADTTAPVLQVPNGIITGATGPGGALVSYQFSATDVDDSVISQSCLPASGTTFATGVTVVGCTATDTSGNVGRAAFTVTVTSAQAAATGPPAATTTTTAPKARPTTTMPAPTTTTTSAAVRAAAVPPPTDPPALPPPSNAPAPPVVTRATVMAVGTDHHPWAPSGGGLSLSGGGYSSCRTVYFFFDGARVGSARPDATGNVVKGGVSVPGDAAVGAHRVTTSCESSGRAIEQTAAFKVVASSAHRTAFVTSLPNPGQVSTNPVVLATSAAVALAIIPLLAFPSQLFNSTLQENYDEITGWFSGRARRRARRAPRAPRAQRPERTLGKLAQAAQFGGFLAIGALLYGLLTPGFGFNRTSLALALGLALALFVICVGFSLPTLTYMRRRYQERGRMRILPGTILIAALCVGLSRLLHFQPGALYGMLAVFAFGRDLDKRNKGRLTAVSAAFILAVSLAAWFIRVPVGAAAGRPGAGLGVLILDAALSAVFLLGLESLVISLLPLRFLDGSNLMAWNRAAWAALFGVGVFAVFHVLLRPGSGYVGHSSAGSMLVVGGFYAGFGVLSVGLWAYFRFRHQPVGGYRPAVGAGMQVGLTE